MTSIHGPVIPRRRIAEELRRQRELADLTLEHVAADLMISTSKLSRLENGHGSPRGRDVRDLIRYYGIEDPMADQLMRWVRAARRQGWWNKYVPALTGGLDVHLAYETEVSVARFYTVPILPGLLQTVGYMRALYERTESGRPPGELDQLVQVRLRRQEALRDREDLGPLGLIAVTHESSIRQLVGSAEIMREQLDQLVERSWAGNVELRVLPFSVTPPFTSTCTYAHFEFSDAADRNVVSVETHAGFRFIDTENKVAQYRRYFDDLYESSLDAEATRDLIRTVRNESFS